MKLSDREREFLLWALRLAIRDRATSIDKDNPIPDLDAESQEAVEMFEGLKRKVMQEKTRKAKR